jgi:asparagine synthase (glutamine-hydrolysing)
MCGIVGVLSTAPLPETLPIEAMRDALSHRGPDDAGLWWSPDRRVAFGHRRLSIIDLSPAGHQPMRDASGALWLTFNGEIYNFVELRAELEQLGHSFRSHSDTAVVLAAYRQWGNDMLARLNGMFAFAIYDSANQKVFLARDRAGEKPLFVSRRGGMLRFASELKAFMVDRSFERRVNLRALDLYLAYAYVPADLCILEDVEKLPAGHAMTFDLRSGATKRWAYWSLPPAATDDQPVDDEQLVSELESLLEDSVRRQMLAADVPVGILLSGGLDSSLITAMAARAVPRVNTFTISFPGHGSYDEAEHARLVAEHFGTNHVVLAASTATVSLMPELARQYDEPMADSSMIPTFLVSRLIRQQATVALGGDGGDELFGGYPHYNWLLRQAHMRRYLPRPISRVVYGAANTLLPVGLRGRNFVLGLTAPQPLRLVHSNSYFDERTRRALLAGVGTIGRNGNSAEGFKLELVESGIAPIDQATRLDFRTYLTDDILVKVDRASMLTSLEVRAPFLDRRILEFSFGRVPARLKATRSERKILLRKLAQRVLPAGFDVKRKQGFSIPLAKWFSGEWGDYMTSVLRGRDSVFDRSAVESLIEGQKRGRSNADRLFALTLFELWRREYRVSV